MANSNVKLDEEDDVHSSDYDSDGRVKVTKKKNR